MTFFKIVTITFNLNHSDELTPEERGAVHHSLVCAATTQEWKARDIEHLVERLENTYGYQVDTINVIET